MKRIPTSRGLARSAGLAAASVLAIGIATTAQAQEVRGPEQVGRTNQEPVPADTAPTTSQTSQSASPSEGLSEILVTARKVEENLQDVPVAVTALSGQQLQSRNATQIADIARLTPGLTIRPASSNATAFAIQIRGQYQNDILATLDPSVGTYVDGFYWARAYGVNGDFLDIQSAQVLRGPQGTLFGRNTTGGAFLIQTNDPNFDGPSGLVSASYGRFDERSATAVLNVPLVSDKLALRVAGTILKRDGYLKSVPFTFNSVTAPTARAQAFPASGDLTAPQPEGSIGRELGDRDQYTVRAKLLAQLTDNLSVILSAEQFRYKAFGQSWRLGAVDFTSPANTEAGVELGNSPATAAALGRSFFAAYIPSAAEGDTISLNEDTSSYSKTRTYTGTVALDTFFGAIKFIAGYRNVKSSSNIDLDGGPIYIVSTLGSQDLSQYSGELQITGKTSSIDYAVGAFYFKEYGIDRSNSVALPAASTLAPGSRLSTNLFVGDIETRSQGLYAQATWHINDALSLTGGLRYSVEDKGLTSFNRPVFSDTGLPVSCSIIGANINSTPEPCRIQRSDDFSGVSYTGSINYQINPDILVYARTSKGFRSGGQNLRASGTAGAAFVPFDPEITYEHELGLKSELFDRRLRFNLAGFYNTINNIQRSTIVSFINPITNAQGTATIVGNAGKVRNYGFEAEATALLFEGFQLAGTASYTNSKYKEYLGLTPAGAVVDRSREPFDQVPPWTFSVTGNYEKELPVGKLGLNANYAWQDTTPINIATFIVDAAGVTRDLATNGVVSAAFADAATRVARQKAGGQLNLRASLTVMDGALEIAAWGRNVFNFRPNINALYFAPPLGVISYQKRDPGTYGATVTFRFGG